MFYENDISLYAGLQEKLADMRFDVPHGRTNIKHNITAAFVDQEQT